MKREELLKDKNFVVTGIQLQLLNLIEKYMTKNNLNRDKLAKELNVTKGYVSQLLNVAYDHKLSKLVELALACNAMPLVFFVDLNEYTKYDASDKIYELMPMVRPTMVTYEMKTPPNMDEGRPVPPNTYVNIDTLKTFDNFKSPNPKEELT